MRHRPVRLPRRTGRWRLFSREKTLSIQGPLSRVWIFYLLTIARGPALVLRAGPPSGGEARLADLGESVCPYCGVGCGLRFEGTGADVVRVRGVESAAANLGGLCAKGAQLGPTIRTPDRLTRPQVRLGRNDDFRAVPWDTAFTYLRECFTNILHTYGPEAVAFYGSGQLDTEAVYVVGKFFKGCLGCNNTDSNSRLCMAAAVAGYRTSLGSDGPPTCYDDIECADVVLVIGSNMAEAHPVTFDRIRDSRKARPEQKLVVIDPRRTPT